MPDMHGSGSEAVGQQLAALSQLLHGGLGGLRRQTRDSVVQAEPGARITVDRIANGLQALSADVDRRLVELGQVADAVDETAEAPPSGAPRVSQTIGDDQAFLQKLLLAFFELQSVSWEAGDDETARLAERGHQETSHLIRDKINRAAPRVAAADQARPAGRQPGVVE